MKPWIIPRYTPRDSNFVVTGKNYKGARQRLVACMVLRAKNLYVYSQRRGFQYRDQEKHGGNARNEIHTRCPVGCIVVICTKDKVACKCDKKPEGTLDQGMTELRFKWKTNKRKNHPTPLPTASSGVLPSPSVGASDWELHPAGPLHSTIAWEPSYDLNWGSDCSDVHNTLRTNVCGVGSNVVEDGYEGPCNVTLTPRGAGVKS